MGLLETPNNIGIPSRLHCSYGHSVYVPSPFFHTFPIPAIPVHTLYALHTPIAILNTHLPHALPTTTFPPHTFAHPAGNAPNNVFLWRGLHACLLPRVYFLLVVCVLHYLLHYLPTYPSSLIRVQCVAFRPHCSTPLHPHAHCAPAHPLPKISPPPHRCPHPFAPYCRLPLPTRAPLRIPLTPRYHQRLPRGRLRWRCLTPPHRPVCAALSPPHRRDTHDMPPVQGLLDQNAGRSHATLAREVYAATPTVPSPHACAFCHPWTSWLPQHSFFTLCTAYPLCYL